MHVNRYVLKTVLRRLLDAGLFPADLRLVLLDRRGHAAPDGSLLVVQAPECLMLADVVGRASIPERMEILGELLRFTRAMLAQGILCVDFSLDQTARIDGGVFVCDYPAYMFANNLARKTVKKPELEAPEELCSELPLEAEAFNVFTLGTLFFQVIFAEPDRPLPFPEAWELRKNEEGAGFSEGIREELSRRLEPGPLSELVASMLAWSPKDRPSLPRVQEVLDQP
jgi:hypothetical protein